MKWWLKCETIIQFFLKYSLDKKSSIFMYALWIFCLDLLISIYNAEVPKMKGETGGNVVVAKAKKNAESSFFWQALFSFPQLSKKRKIWIFRIDFNTLYLIKLCYEGSISLTFYEQLFCTKVICVDRPKVKPIMKFGIFLFVKCY